MFAQANWGGKLQKESSWKKKNKTGKVDTKYWRKCLGKPQISLIA